MQKISALTIAGSDSGGGAGIQADLKTFFAHSIHGLSVITANTAQNTQQVFETNILDSKVVSSQLKAVVQDYEIAAIKLGMLGSLEIVRELSQHFKADVPDNLVIDPVFISTSGSKLIEEEAISLLANSLFPLAKIITPNMQEACELLNISEQEVLRDPQAACEKLVGFGCESVVITGGDLDSDESVDFLLCAGEFKKIAAKRIDTKNTHGSGCTFSAAITASLAKGMGVIDSVLAAKEFTLKSIVAAKDLKIGKGRGGVDQSFVLR